MISVSLTIEKNGFLIAVDLLLTTKLIKTVQAVIRTHHLTIH